MNSGNGILLLAILGGLFCVTSAKNRVCVNANSQILKLYCDGVDYTHMLPNRKNHFKCDCIFLPVCKVLAVKAKGIKDGQKSSSAMNVCQTAQPEAFDEWLCKAAPKVPGKSAWNALTYVRDKKWKKPVKPDDHCAHCHCHKARLLPCKSQCFWNPFPPAASIDCVRTQCAQDCTSCALTGPGNCDPGMCKYGLNQNTYTNVPVCNHKCSVEFQVWDNAGTGVGWLKVRDTVSHSVEKFVANMAGLYLAVIDMNQCSFIYKNYSIWNNAGYNALIGSGSILLKWSGDQLGPMQNNIAVHIGVGQGTIVFKAPTPAPSPAIEFYVLGKGVRTPLIPTAVPLKNFCNGVAHLTGVTNGNVTVDSFTYSNPC